MSICSSYFSSHPTYDHRTTKIELPVRSAVLKRGTGGLVVRWVTTSEYPLLYVFALFFNRYGSITACGYGGVCTAGAVGARGVLFLSC
jgi:hypothetical protein